MISDMGKLCKLIYSFSLTEGKNAGAIGVGGGTEEQDCAVAEYVVSIFEEETK